MMRASDAALLSIAAAALALAASTPLSAQGRVAPVYATAEHVEGNVDSCVVWVAPDPDDSLLFVTEKDGDRIEVFHAGTGLELETKPFLGGVPDGSAPGELNRPNGVWVLYHVRFTGGFTDVLLTTDQLNKRVQAFKLPELEYFGELGTNEVGKGYGLASYHDGTNTFVFVTDNAPPAAAPGKIKKYRLRLGEPRIAADLLFGVGSSAGTPPLPNVESIVADPVLDRLHVCGDEGGKFNRIFRLDGTYTGIEYGDPQFEFDQEGINLYDLGFGAGYLVVSDQHTDGTPNQFELFDRSSLASLGNFESAAGTLITRNTDGAYLEQRPLPGLPDGAFFAVNDDRNCHAYDWTAVAEALRLEIAPLDRPFPGSLSAGAGSSETRSALWFHDGSWWAALPRGDDLVIARLEDGTFAAQGVGVIDLAAPASAAASGDELMVLSAGAAPRLHAFVYEPEHRRYVRASAAADVAGAVGPHAEVFSGPAVAWAAGGSARVRLEDLTTELGASADVTPRFTVVPGGLGVAWAEPAGVAFRVHVDGAAPADWLPREAVDASAAASLAAAALPDDGRVALVAEAADGQAWLRVRSPSGAWSGRVTLGEGRRPSLVVDAAARRVHLFHGKTLAGHTVLHHRESPLAPLAFGPSSYFAGWPGVSMGAPCVPRDAPAEAHDLIAAALGDDGLGYFARVRLERSGDLTPPITLEHSPAPGSAAVGPRSAATFRLTDDAAGVDRSQVRVIVNGAAIAPTIRGVPRSRLVEFKLPGGPAGADVSIRIEASDLSVPPRVMTPFEWSVRLSGAASTSFIRGDANGDGALDISDAVRIALDLFAAGPGPSCLEADDANDDGRVDVSDVVRLLGYLFRRGAALAGPATSCGLDPTADALGCDSAAACGP